VVGRLVAVVDFYALTFEAGVGLAETRFGFLEVVFFVDADLFATGLFRLLEVVLLVDADLFAVLVLVLRWELWALLVAVLLTDVDLLTALLLWATAVFENTYVFGIGFAALSRLGVSREGFLVFRVTFPPCLWLFCFCFYLELLVFLDGVLADVPVAGREDTERDGNSCVKIQRAGVVASLLYPLNERMKKRLGAPCGKI
jgi:hypothetical protein